jgi:predicted  nucleic acid-binding Zn-ribbon protein
MPGITDLIRDLHRLRRHIRELEAEIQRTPELQKTRKNRVAKQETLLHDAQEALKKLKISVHENEVSLKATHAQIKKYEQQLNTAAAKKEYDALQAEIAHARQTAAKLEDDIFAGLTEIDERTAALPVIEKTLQEMKAEFNNWERDAKERVDRLTDELIFAKKNLTDTESALPPDIRATYVRLITSWGVDGLASVKDKTCMHCYSALTGQQVNDLIQGKFGLCKSCGRALYLQ